MTRDNSETQNLMWKYKEEFTMKELGSRMQEGELDFVLAIIDDSPEAVKLNQNKWNISCARYFVNCLRSRMNDKENFVILLEIFNKLIKFQIFSFLRQPLTRLILDTREFIISYDKDNERDFIRALNTQEIVYSIICNQQMKFMRKLLRSYFPFKDMMKQIEMSMERLNELEQQNKDLDSEDFDELREDQYIDIVNIYIQVYLSSKFSESNKEEIAKEFADHIFVQYFQMLSDFKEKTDFNDRSTYNLSTLRFLMIYMNVFIANFKKYMNFANDTTFQGNLARSHTERDFPTQFIKMKAYQYVKIKLSSIEEIYNDIIEEIKKSTDEYLEIDLETIEKHINHNITTISKREGSSKFCSCRSDESLELNKIWKDYINYVSSSRDGRQLVDKEHHALVNVMFNSITKEHSNPLTVQSFKKFISGSITFTYTTEQTNWSLYIIIFVFKINSLLLDQCFKKLRDEHSNVINKKIRSEILDSVDTLRICDMMFKMLCNQNNKHSLYMNEVFCIVSYFLGKLLDLRPNSIQEKFMGFFSNDPISQNFFRDCYEYIEVHKDKLAIGILKDFYKDKKFKDELSHKCYLVDKNLEKQIVSLMKRFCSHDNREMQDYIRFQENSGESYDLVTLIANYACEFKHHLQFTVAYDTFIACMDALFEFVQGPNFENQEILIQSKFAELSNQILMLEYRDTEQVDEVNKYQIKVTNQSFIMPSSFNYGGSTKSLYQTIAAVINVHDNEISMPSTNFMIGLSKFKCVTILLQLLVGRDPNSYVYYLFRRVLDPELFRLNLAYTYDFRSRYNNGKYTMDLFFKYSRSIDDPDDSPLIIEIGFRLYYLLLKMKDNFYIDMDEKYLNRVLVLLSSRTKSSDTVKKGIIGEFTDFFSDVYDLVTYCCRATSNNVVKSRVYSLKENDNKMRFIFKFFADHSTQIEILKDGKLLTQHFPLLPFCKFSSEDPKEYFMQHVNRTNSKTKCESLMRESSYMIIDLKVNYWLTSEKNRFGQIFQKHIDLWKDILLYLCFLLNCMILASYNVLNGNRTKDPELGSLNSTQTKVLFYVFGGFTLFLIATILINTLASKIPIKIKKHNTRIAEKSKRQVESGDTFYFGTVGSFYDKLYNFCVLLMSIFTDVHLIFFSGLFIMTILGLILDPLYYTYLITYLIYKSETLMSVLQAVWIPRYSIGVTIILLFIVTYVLTVFSYYYYGSDYPDNTCYSLWSCFVISYDQTFKTGSGIGGYLSSAYFVNGSKESIRYGRVIYDNFQYLVIYVILINIITGIIIDTFGNLRQKNYDRYIDSKSSCFICEKSREELEKEYGVNGFEYHTNNHHNLWDYIFFISYLQTKMKAAKQLTILERYAYDKLQKDDYTWLPCYA